VPAPARALPLPAIAAVSSLPAAAPSLPQPVPRIAAALATPLPPPIASSQQLDHARALARAGQTEAARTVYQELLADAHARPKAEVALAELAWKAGRYDEAIARATAAAAAGVGAPAYFVRGLAELRVHQPDAAARDFTRVLAVEPDNEDARAGLARAQALQRGAAQ
jgi:predicted Zn-dependent protease